MILKAIDLNISTFIALAYNVSGIGEEAVSESSIELQIFKLKIKCQTKNKTAFLPIPC